jgi:hypothetical protein
MLFPLELVVSFADEGKEMVLDEAIRFGSPKK